MKRFIILLLVALAMAVGYLLGTEQGRQQRDQLMEAVNKKRGILPEAGEVDLAAVEEAAEEATEAASQMA